MTPEPGKPPKDPPTPERPQPASSGGGGQAAGWPCGDGSLSPRSKARTSDSRNLRCPPGVRILVMRPEAAHRVTVFGSTRNSAATSPGVSRRSLLPSTQSPPTVSLGVWFRYASSLALNEYFLPRFLEIDLAFRSNCTTKGSHIVAISNNRTSLQVFRSALASQGALTRR
jgi:hypothetical protein